MKYLYWFTLLLLALTLDSSALVMNECMREAPCRLNNVGARIATGQVEGGGLSSVLLIILFALMVAIIVFLVFSIFMHLKQEHTFKTMGDAE
ncbi:MAG: hypothetical protein V1735_00915 [Nanoarchaeota archaeon]